MTDPVMIDIAALEAVVRHVATIADALIANALNTNESSFEQSDTDELARAITNPSSTALVNSAVSRINAPRLVSNELDRIRTALHEWVDDVRRSATALGDAEVLSAGRFSMK